MTEAEIRADERRRIVQAIQRLIRADYSPSNIWRHYYPSATGDWVDLREVLKVVRGTDGVATSVEDRARTLYSNSPRAYRGTRPLPWDEAPEATRMEFMEKARGEHGTMGGRCPFCADGVPVTKTTDGETR